MAVRLFVGNLPYDATEAELRAHFAVISPLSYISLPTDRETGKPRGFAFVEFSDRADAEEAIRRLNQQPFKGRLLAVNEARARDEHAPPRPATPRPATPRPATPRPPSTGGSASPEPLRDFGPDAAPRRRRMPTKSNSRAERGPKRPMYKRTPGPVRFSLTDDDEDDADEAYDDGGREMNQHDAMDEPDKS